MLQLLRRLHRAQEDKTCVPGSATFGSGAQEVTKVLQVLHGFGTVSATPEFSVAFALGEPKPSTTTAGVGRSSEAFLGDLKMDPLSFSECIMPVL